MNSKSIIQIIVIICSIVLGMLLYPIVLKKWRKFVSWLYRMTYNNGIEDKEVIPQKEVPKLKENPSIIGESRTIIGHTRTKATTNAQDDGVTKKEDIFVPDSEENPQPMEDIDFPLEKEGNMSEDEFDEEEESINLEVEQGATLASGASYDELTNTNEVIHKEKATDDEKDEAGRILHENKTTELFESMMASSEELSNSITAIIDFHLAKRAEELQKHEQLKFPLDYKDFDFNTMFND